MNASLMWTEKTGFKDFSMVAEAKIENVTSCGTKVDKQTYLSNVRQVVDRRK